MALKFDKLGDSVSNRIARSAVFSIARKRRSGDIFKDISAAEESKPNKWNEKGEQVD